MKYLIYRRFNTTDAKCQDCPLKAIEIEHIETDNLNNVWESAHKNIGFCEEVKIYEEINLKVIKG